MIRSEYDSQADAISIDLVEVDRWDHSEDVDPTGSYCTVAIKAGRAVNVELLTPRDSLEWLAAAAKRYELDVELLEAAAEAALAAPDRVVTLDFSAQREPQR